MFLFLWFGTNLNIFPIDNLTYGSRFDGDRFSVDTFAGSFDNEISVTGLFDSGIDRSSTARISFSTGIGSTSSGCRWDLLIYHLYDDQSVTAGKTVTRKSECFQCFVPIGDDNDGIFEICLQSANSIYPKNRHYRHYRHQLSNFKALRDDGDITP